MGERRTQQPDSEHALDENDREEESLVEKAKDKVRGLVDAPEAVEYDEGETNPVTGQRRD